MHCICSVTVGGWGITGPRRLGSIVLMDSKDIYFFIIQSYPFPPPLMQLHHQSMCCILWGGRSSSRGLLLGHLFPYPGASLQCQNVSIGACDRNFIGANLSTPGKVDWNLERGWDIRCTTATAPFQTIISPFHPVSSSCLPYSAQLPPSSLCWLITKLNTSVI